MRTLLLAGALDDAANLGNDLNKLLITVVMGLGVTLATIVAWRTTKSIVAAFMAALGGVALWYVVSNAAAFRDSIGEDIAPGGGTAAPHAVVRVEPSRDAA
ncbi:hypothetical protein [Streptomyces sp. NRRL F-5630]|uniref:hypothetical protein n=1 Tax=Streptomyces sp. NRRL F-5630 TaxID=1463864 RepID=UPI003D73FA4B